MNFKVIDKVTSNDIIDIEVLVETTDEGRFIVSRNLRVDKKKLSERQVIALTEWLNKYSNLCGTPLNSSDFAMIELGMLSDISDKLQFVASFIQNGWYIGDNPWTNK